MPTLQQMKLCFTRAADPVKQKAITRLCHRSVLQWDYLVGGKDYVPEDAIPERLRAWLAAQRALCVIWIRWYAGLMRELRNMRSVSLFSLRKNREWNKRANRLLNHYLFCILSVLRCLIKPLSVSLSCCLDTQIRWKFIASDRINPVFPALLQCHGKTNCILVVNVGLLSLLNVMQ